MIAGCRLRVLGLISVPFPNVEGYTAAKHGVVGLTRALACEYGERGIQLARLGAARRQVVDDVAQAHAILVGLVLDDGIRARDQAEIRARAEQHHTVGQWDAVDLRVGRELGDCHLAPDLPR